MKIKELLELLKEQDPETEVVMSRDAEGNGYSPLAVLDTCFYQAESTWHGEIRNIYDEEIDEYIEENGVTREEAVKIVFKDFVLAIALWPTN